MAELIYRQAVGLQSLEGVVYDALVFGQARHDGLWEEGWIEFHPANAATPVLSTLMVTTQPDLASLRLWIAGLCVAGL